MRKSAESLKKGAAPKGSRFIGQLNRPPTVQIALRLPEPDPKVKRRLPAAPNSGTYFSALLMQ